MNTDETSTSAGRLSRRRCCLLNSSDSNQSLNKANQSACLDRTSLSLVWHFSKVFGRQVLYGYSIDIINLPGPRFGDNISCESLPICNRHSRQSRPLAGYVFTPDLRFDRREIDTRSTDMTQEHVHVHTYKVFRTYV